MGVCVWHLSEHVRRSRKEAFLEGGKVVCLNGNKGQTREPNKSISPNFAFLPSSALAQAV